MKGCVIQSCLVFFSVFFAFNSCALTSPSFPRDQSFALIQFNNSFSIDCSSSSYSTVYEAKTMSWKEGTNCCLWDGVTCDADTGNVIGLDLSCSCLAGHFPSNSTLFLLRHLQELNLAYNDFSMTPMASQFGELTGLTHLNISESGFSGKIPFEISHLSKLLSFDLSANYGLMLEGHVFESMAGNLTQLRHLVLSGVNMSSVEPASFLNMSSYITTLALEGSGLQGKFPEHVFHFPHLEKFSVWGSDLEVKFPKTNWSGPLKSLRVSHSYLQELPDSIGSFRPLEVLDLSFSNLRGPIPASLANLTQLKYLDLSNNNHTGLLPFCLFSLPSLGVMQLRSNKLTGPIPDPVSQFVNLISLDLSSNDLSGSFELDKLSNLSQLRILDLSNNPLLSLSSASSNATYSLPNLWSLNLSCCNTSEFPNFVRNLQGLEDIDLSHNKIRFIEANMFVKLKSLRSLDLSHNTPLSINNINNLTLVFPGLSNLMFSSCNITEFSNFLTTQEGLFKLDLSNNSIQGQITKQETNWGSSPIYLDLSNNLLTAVEYSSWENLQVLNLGSNLLEGPLLPPPPSIMVLIISNNRLTGEIPTSMCTFEYEILVLDISHNNLSGEIPKCLSSTLLHVLDLHMNHFHGNIPPFSVENTLRKLNLNNNDFDGPLPKSLANCHFLEVLNLGNNKINDTFPHWLGTLPQLQVLILRSNHFHGQLINLENGSHFSTLQILDLSHNEFSGLLPTTYFKSFQGMMSLANVQMGYIGDGSSYYHDSVVVTMKGVDLELERILTIFATLDMSSNRFEGTVPETVGNLVSLQVLNFSHNHLIGHIPSSLGNLAALESLDLSCNKLVGGIPSQLTALNFLEWLNLSENHLVGLIPQGKQFNTFLNDSYVGNPGLCGFPVSKGCGHSGPPPPATSVEHESDSAFGLDWKFVMMGYGCGMVFGFSAGYIMMTIRKPKWLVGMIQRAGNKVVRRFKKYR
ncbi:receptor like protein 6 [Hibiscus trionum]|uniref:Receptor like protein 6 n=1 Tax=Hibiscus trionum TaxID=183268 RepID=A0A9W7J0L9_HIBTR|nr:receptor like protein 6 [Hibiscus trionum]